MNHRDLDQRDEELIGQLIQTSGRGPTASTDARNRVYGVVHAEWRRNVATEIERDRGKSWNWISIRWLLKPGFALAAIAVVALGISVFLRGPDIEAISEVAAISKWVGSVEIVGADGERSAVLAGADPHIYTGQILATGRDGRVALNFADGLSLRIDSNSELLVASAESIELKSGAVYLDTGPRASSGSRFEVATRLGVVRHMGTQYEVRFDDRDLRIRVREGAVRISDEQQELVGEAGEQILLPESGAVIRTSIPVFGAEWQWTEALANLPEASEYRLSELLSWIARQTGRELQFDAPALETEAAALVLHSVGGLTPLETFEVISSTTALNFRITDDSLIVYQGNSD